MLVLKRKYGESIIINDDIQVMIIGIGADFVKLGVTAPPEVPVHREEVWLAIHRDEPTEPESPATT